MDYPLGLGSRAGHPTGWPEGSKDAPLKHTTKMTTTQNTIAVLVNYVGPTNTKGARIKLTLPLWEKRAWLSYNYEERDAEAGALRWFAEANLHPIARACNGSQVILLFSFDNAESIRGLF